MPDFIDQTGRKASLRQLPRKIISLVPSQTELLADLGLDEEVVGITKFCIHPKEWLHQKIRVGGTKQLKLDIIRQLNPDLVIANKEENVKEQVEAIEKEFPVWVSDINNLEDAYEMIGQIGAITNREQQAQVLISTIRGEFARLISTNPGNLLSAVYLIWQKPYMTIGGDTFINAMMKEAGFYNLFSNEKRYPEITIAQIQEWNPSLLLLSSEPFPFSEKHIDSLQPLLPNTRMLLVDGEMFSWYGSRLRLAPAYFKTLNSYIGNRES